MLNWPPSTNDTEILQKRISVWEVSIQVFTAKLFRLCSVFEIFTVKSWGDRKEALLGREMNGENAVGNQADRRRDSLRA